MDLDEPLPMVIPRRRWMWLTAVSPSATVGDLADALAAWGVDLADGVGTVCCDGEPVDTTRLLADLAVRAGTRWHGARPGVTAGSSAPALVEVCAVGGAAAGSTASLSIGCHLAGAADGLAVHVADRGAAPHAAVLEVGGTSERPWVRVTHLGGEVPRVDEVPVTDLTPWPAGSVLRMGATRWTWRPVTASSHDAHRGRAPAPPDTPWREVQRRGRSAGEDPSPTPLLPEPAAMAAPAFTPSVVATVTGLTVAAVMRQPLLAVMGASSLVATGAWWSIVRLRARRRARRRRRLQEQVAHDDAHRVRRQHPSLDVLMAMASGHHAGLWERRPHRHHHTWHVTLGEGRQRGEGATWWPEVPVVVDLGPGTRVGLGGGGAAALARALIAQLVTHVGPADLTLQMRTPPHDRRYDDLRVLPHAHSRAAHRLVVVVPSADDARWAAEAETEAAWLVIDDRAEGDTLEAWCHTVVRWDGLASCVDVRADGDLVGQVAPAGVSSVWLHDLVRALVVWRDPEAAPVASAHPPVGSSVCSSVVTWADVHPGCGASGWKPPWDTPGEGLSAVLGRGARGRVVVDLVRHGPHALVAGTTGSGKSELLRTLVLGWAWSTAPDRLQFVLIDHKGGAAFDACVRLPHVVGVITDLDGDLNARVLTGLRAELTRRERLLRAAGVSDVTAWWRGSSGDVVPPRLVIVVDEVAALVHDHPEVMTALVALAQRGRSLGVHLVLATQRPAGVVRDDVRANTELRMCLRVADRADALEVVGDPRPAGFDRGRPGQVLVRSGAQEPVEVQVADTSRPWDDLPPPVRVSVVGAAEPGSTGRMAPTALSTLTHVVEHLADAARRWPHPPPVALWAPPLPAVLAESDDPTVVGMLDDVAHQRWLPLRCDATGHAVIIGAPRSGVTTTLRRILVGRSHHRIVALGEADPCVPVMDALLASLDEGRSPAAARSPVTVVIDGVGSWRRRWEHELGTAGWQATAAWERLLSDGPAMGVVVLAGADRVASCGTTLWSVATTRWLLRPRDPLDAVQAGVRWPSGPAGDTPPGRLVDAASGLTGQVAFSTPSTMCTVRSA